MGLFGSRRLVDLRIPSGKPGIEGAKALEAYAADPNPDNVTLITLPRIDRQGAVVRVVHRARGARDRRRRAAARTRSAATVDRSAPRAAEAEGVAGDARVPRRALRGQPPRRAAGDREARAAAPRGLARPRGRRGGRRGRGPLRRLRGVRGVAGRRRRARGARAAAWFAARARARSSPCGRSSEDLHAIAAIQSMVREGTPLASALRNVRVWGKRQQAMEKAVRRVRGDDLVRFLVALVPHRRDVERHGVRRRVGRDHGARARHRGPAGTTARDNGLTVSARRRRPPRASPAPRSPPCRRAGRAAPCARARGRGRPPGPFPGR